MKKTITRKELERLQFLGHAVVIHPKLGHAVVGGTYYRLAD